MPQVYTFALDLENCTPVIKADNTNQLRPNKTFGILKTENNVCSGFTKSLYNFLFLQRLLILWQYLQKEVNMPIII